MNFTGFVVEVHDTDFTIEMYDREDPSKRLEWGEIDFTSLPAEERDMVREGAFFAWDERGIRFNRKTWTAADIASFKIRGAELFEALMALPIASEPQGPCKECRS